MHNSNIIGCGEESQVIGSSLLTLGGDRFSTADQPQNQRLDWLKEVIGREYANVDITPPKAHKLYNDMLMYPWDDDVRLSPIRSNPVTLERLPQEPTEIAHDCYFIVILTSGQYKLQQGGREVYLQPGEMSFYDATLPHRIEMPSKFSKILISIPRQQLHQRLADIGNLTAKRIPTARGIGAITSTTIQAVVGHLHEMERYDFLQLRDHVLDLITLSAGQISKGSPSLYGHREMTLRRVKRFIAAHITDHELNALRIAEGTGLSIRYINNLFSGEHTSLMRYLTSLRLEACRRCMLKEEYKDVPISTIALHHGFKNMSHFSRTFKKRYGIAPSDFRRGG
jgi:AraC-like DNA-binding protein/mannose-6-phosphate isomerase-like protein (cupin superfamily)